MFFHLPVLAAEELQSLHDAFGLVAKTCAIKFGNATTKNANINSQL